jgi:oxalate decarboxylase/phosphoglucose isomerase-like protein (cupin superfamily)
MSWTPLVNPSDKRHWHYDSEEAEAYLVIKLSADMTVKQAVRESRESSGK